MGRTDRKGPMGRGGLVGWASLALSFIFVIAIMGRSIVYATAGDASESVQLTVGRSTVLNTGTSIARVSLTSPDVADAVVTSASEVLVNGKAPGTISMFVWDRAGAIRRYEVVVQRDLARLSEQLRDLFPGESISAQSNGKSVVLSGHASKKDVIEKAISVAAGYVDKKEDVVSLLQVEGGANQVLLRVRFAEVSRSALTELGASFFTSPNGFHNVVGRTTTQQFAAPTFDSTDNGNKLVFSDFLNFFLWDFKHDLGTVIKALQTRGLFQSLAEPNLVAESGKEASFLAGGEFPVPIAQGSGNGTTVTVMYKEFGIRLNFTPVINGDRVHLKVRPEVSSLDFGNAVVLQGFRIPALSTRRTETELELQDGQTFAIAGLINNTMTKSIQKIPGIGDIPILGLLFQSQAAQKDRTELVVMITPQILPRSSNGVTNTLPRLSEPFLPTLDPKKSIEPAAPAFQPSRGAADNRVAPAPAPAPVPAPVAAQPAATDPAAAAATLGGLTSNTRPVTHDPAPAQQPAATQAAPARAMSKQEQAALEQSKKADQARLEAEKKQQETDKKRQAEANRKQAEDAKRQEKAAKEQAERDAKAAARQAAIEKAAQEGAAKRAAEQAKRQAELDKQKQEVEKQKQKAISDAEAKMKAAQDAYDAEIARAKSNSK
jgi:pilus assembly protein CpaC